MEVLATWPQALVALLFGALALAGVYVTWEVTPFAAADPLTLEILGGALIVASFPLLVVERSYAGTAPEMLPDAPQLDRLLRVPLTVCLGLGITSVLRALGFNWAVQVERGLAILTAAIALEIVVRSLAVAFVPFARSSGATASPTAASRDFCAFRRRASRPSARWCASNSASIFRAAGRSPSCSARSCRSCW